MKVNINSLLALLPIVLDPPVQPDVITTDGGGAFWSHIFAEPKKILSRESFPAGQLRFIFDMDIVATELLFILQLALFVSV